MNPTIWKYPLELTDEQTVKMPLGAQILSVQVQRGHVCLWALCNELAPQTDRRIFIHGTGHIVSAKNPKFLGTVQLEAGALVFHVFEESQ
jgi:hypothetical protein